MLGPLALGKQRQEDQEFNVIVCHIANLRLNPVTGEPVFKKIIINKNEMK